ncbi:MAG: VOC family protein [Sphingobacteriales bacterium]|nr:VOC family protein [Sphingobacteriales bacterium]
MEAIVPYLNFNGNAAEALAFYSKALNGTIVSQQTFADAPMPSSEAMKDKILHAVFQSGALTIMVSDCPPEFTSTPGTNVSLSLNFPDVESIDKTFTALSEGGQVTMELQDTFWGARFGMIIDKFGINWMFNHDKKEGK